MSNISEVSEKKPINLGNIVIVAMTLNSLLVGFVPQQISAYIMLLLCAVMLFIDELYLALPLVIFYNQWYGTVFGVSVQRFFSLMIMVLFLVKLGKEKKITLKYLAPFIIYLLYSVFVITQYNTTRAIFSVVDIVCCIFIVSMYLNKDIDKLKRFFIVYALTGIAAIITGMLNQNIMAYGNLNRFMATFEDPNYMSFFYTIAIFSIMSLKIFKPWLRAIVVVVFSAAIIASASVTGIIVNVMLWLIYVTLVQKINIKTFVALIVVFVLIFGIYKIGLNSSDDTMLGQMSGRIEEKIQELNEGNVSDATTGRSQLMRENFEYFLKQPFWKKLVGGTPVNTHYISYDVERAAHNEYVDLLINVGVIGTGILLWFFFKQYISYLKKYLKNRDKHYLTLFMIKCVWVAYAFSLTVFMDYRFMFVFFM